MTNSSLVASKPPKKRIAIFLDGTWNVADDNTNVWRMKSLCAPRSSDELLQLAYYSVGVGTSRGEEFTGGAFGYGLDHEIVQAYEWLIDHYDEGDEVFIFGFSRGAFTARSLAGFIAKCGLLIPGAALGVKQLYSRYHKGAEERTIWKLHADLQSSNSPALTLEEKWMLKYSMRVPIKMVGVWDTVGALGIPFLNIRNISRSTFGWLHTGLRLSIEHGFHAVAVDEHRAAFCPTLWSKKTHTAAGDKNAPARPLTSVEQRWFAGAHANVGGGYQNDLLAQKPLRWMMSKSSLLGLSFRSNISIDGDVDRSPIIDSYGQFGYGLYRIVSRPYYRPIGAAPVATADATDENVNETIDASVFQRWRDDNDYRPQNLMDWAKRNKADIANLNMSVMARDPMKSVPD